jgi:hypothetical protein
LLNGEKTIIPVDRDRLINFGQHTGLTAMQAGIYRDMQYLYYHIKDNCRSGLLKYMAEALSLLPKINAPKIGFEQGFAKA